MSREPKVSIIVPVYNVAPYLRQCLDSLLQQTLKEIEILCVNDGSTDDSLQILEEYAEQDKRLIVISQENKGSSVARNFALQEARGKYILFVDSDDWIDSSLCEKAYMTAEKHQTDIVLFDYFMVPFGKKKLKPRREFDLPANELLELDATKIVFKTPTYIWNKLYRTEFLRQNDLLFPEGLVSEDTYFTFIMWMKAQTLVYMPECLYFYRTGRPSSVVTSQGYKYLDIIQIYKMITVFLEKNNLVSKYRDNLRDFAIATFVDVYICIDDVYKNDVLAFVKTLDADIREEVMMRIKCYSRYVRVLGIPLFSMRRNLNKTDFKFLGLPMLQIRYGLNNMRGYLFGMVPFFSIRKRYK